jgi:hypothetical protein
LKELIRADFERLLDNDGLLSNHIAYGRVSYDITLRKHLDNASRPEDVSSISSRRIATNIVSEHPELAAVEAIPLAGPSPDAVVSGDRASRDITSPNQERLRAGLPVPVDVRQQDNTRVTEYIKYPRPDTIMEDTGLIIEDVTKGAADSLGIQMAAYGGSDPT